jgi:hypothetical protein
MKNILSNVIAFRRHDGGRIGRDAAAQHRVYLRR